MQNGLAGTIATAAASRVYYIASYTVRYALWRFAIKLPLVEVF